MFGVLHAGGCYLPINLGAPEARLRGIMDQFDADVVVTDAETIEKLPVFRERRHVLIDGAADWPELVDPIEGDSRAYVMFTSGSTGQPKGVTIPRDALAHYWEWLRRRFPLAPGQRVSQQPNIGFDLSIMDIYTALGSGATLVPLNTRLDHTFPARFIRDFAIDLWISVPSVVDLMLRANQVNAEYLSSVKTFAFCGEPLLPHHLKALFSANPQTTVVNAYGPTEATVSCTEQILTAANYQQHCDDQVALGDPIEGMEIDLIGGPNANEGEIVISGPQLADGYWNDPEKTASVFRPHPTRGVRCYFSGDWAQRIDRNLYFQNRTDRQIKLAGHRIELGEIDCVLREAGARLAHTVFVGGQLVSFVEAPAAVSVQTLTKHVRENLPDYTVPRDIRILDMLPRNVNDKVDSKALEKLV